MVSDTPSARRSALLFLSFAVALSVLVASAVKAQEEPAEGAAESTEESAAETTAEDTSSKLEVTKYYIEIKPGIYLRVEGMRARKQARIQRWIAMLEGDRRAIYERFGYPNSRHRESDGDRVTEHWSYVSEEKRFVFRGDDLIREARY